MIFTGERVIPDQMNGDTLTLQEHLARYIWALQFCHNKKVLDVACGTGYGLEILSMVASEVVGADLENEALKYAREYYQFHGKPSLLMSCDFSKQTFKEFANEGEFDVITSFETIEHLEDPRFFLDNVFKALAPGGVFLFSIPNANPSQFHKQVYDLEGAKKLISQNFYNVAWQGQELKMGQKITNETKFFLGVAFKNLI